MSPHFYYNMDGQPISLEEAIPLFELDEARRVDLTAIGHYVVSTVLLVINHRFTNNGKPLIFETMVFDQAAKVIGENDSVDEFTMRYETLKQAKAGHRIVCDGVREKVKDVSVRPD